MRLTRIDRGEGPRAAVISEGLVYEVDSWPSPNEAFEKQSDGLSLESVRLLAPIEPRKIIGIGRNYAAHARELGNEVPDTPLMFLKPGTSVIGHEDEIVLPPESLSSNVHYEGELAIVIGKRARGLNRKEWRSIVIGFCCANDVTARDLQKADVQFTRGKGFDTFCPLGPWIETDLEIDDLKVETRLNGETVQSGRTSQMIFPPSVLIETITEVMTLEPGDVILTGTPEGVGPLSKGDRVEVEIAGIGVLRNRVA